MFIKVVSNVLINQQEKESKMKKNLVALVMVIAVISYANTTFSAQSKGEKKVRVHEIKDYDPIRAVVIEDTPLSIKIPTDQYLEVTFLPKEINDWKVEVHHVQKELKDECLLARMFEGVLESNAFIFLGDMSACYQKSVSAGSFTWRNKKEKVMRIIISNNNPSDMNIVVKITKE